MATQLLLADDSPTIAKILQMSLQNEPYVIRSVLTAENAIKELKANPPALFLVDLTLPVKNGYDFARMVRQDPKLSGVRVVLLASAFDPVDEAEFQDCAADAVVKKPFDPAELRSKLRAILDAPPKFPTGARVTGSLSGFAVGTNTKITGAEPSSPDISPPAAPEIAAPVSSAAPPSAPVPVLEEATLGAATPMAEHIPSENDVALPGSGATDDELAGLLQGNVDYGSNANADAILAGILGGNAEPAVALPEAVQELPPETFERGNATVALDLSGQLESIQSPEAVLDLSNDFNTPPGGTAIIDMSIFGAAAALAAASAPVPAAVVSPVAAEKPPAAPPAESEELSANAQALAAFFSAEIQSQAPSEPPAAPAASLPPASPPAKAPVPAPVTAAAPTPPPEEHDSFDASLDSIDWETGGAAEASLDSWSSSPAPMASKPGPAPDSPPPFSPAAPSYSPAAPASAPMSAGASTGTGTRAPAKTAATQAPTRKTYSGAVAESMLFDTGSSNFRFAEDYITRITKSFTGLDNETMPEQAAPPASALFPQQSDDSKQTARPSFTGGGAWSENEVQKIEQIVREEVQMVVREVAEKIAWEVIPELAENLIRKELEKVLKEMEP